MPDIHNLGPWAFLFGILSILVGLIAGVNAAPVWVVIAHVVLLICVLVTLAGRNRNLRWRLTDLMLIVIGLSTVVGVVFSTGFLEGLPIWGMSLFQLVVGLLMIFDLKTFYNP